MIFCFDSPLATMAVSCDSFHPSPLKDHGFLIVGHVTMVQVHNRGHDRGWCHLGAKRPGAEMSDRSAGSNLPSHRTWLDSRCRWLVGPGTKKDGKNVARNALASLLLFTTPLTSNGERRTMEDSQNHSTQRWVPLTGVNPWPQVRVSQWAATSQQRYRSFVILPRRWRKGSMKVDTNAKKNCSNAKVSPFP